MNIESIIFRAIHANTRGGLFVLITTRFCLHKIGMVFFLGGIGLTLLLNPNIGTHALGETILGVDSLFVNTFQYASHAESTLVLLHVLVVIVQSANGKVARWSKI